MTVMGEEGHMVPTIPPDLRGEETIQQIADSLEQLEKVANDVFSRISKRVADNRNRLQKVNDRVNVAQARVDKLKGSNKATKVFASSKYPADGEASNFPTLFPTACVGDGTKPGRRKRYKVLAKHPATDERVLREKLQFYNVHLNTKSRRDVDMGEGLGGLPRTLPSVSSLLLFNTTENPYKKYTMLDPLGVVTKTRAAVAEGGTGPADAPTTIMHNEEMQRQQLENYFYQPEIGNVPELAVPDNLPNLFGIADDVMFSGDQGQSIAPSVLTTAIPDLPAIEPEPIVVPPGPNASSSAPPPPGPAAPPPPPPPGPPPPGPPAAAPPPPPPPPPPGPPPPPLDGGAPPSAPPPAEVPEEVAGGGRSSLMDAIRAAGGAGKAKLRSAKERKQESKKKKQEEKEKGATGGGGGGGGGGDLMSDLFNKLSMRRKGISGSGKTDSGSGGGGGGGGSSGTGGGSAMDKISSMIPAPPKPNHDGGEEDDWGE